MSVEGNGTTEIVFTGENGLKVMGQNLEASNFDLPSHDIQRRVNMNYL